jgi:hypothetical protein
LERLKKKGVVVPRTYTMNSSYEEIKFWSVSKHM